MRLQPIVYTTDPGAVTAWYRAVLDIDPSFESDMWTAFDVEGATLGIHRVEGPLSEGGRIHVSLIAAVPLEVVVERLTGVSVPIESGIEDQPFGRSILVRDPEGNPVQINEHRS